MKKIIYYFKRKSFLFLPFLAGFLLAFSRLPLNSGFLVFFGLIPLFLLFEKKLKFKKIIFSGLIFGGTYTVTALHWISLVTVPGFLGTIFLFGFYFTILFFLISHFWHKYPRLKYVNFIVFWGTFEFLQNFGEFRFPWFNLGYSLAEYFPFIQLAEIGGVYLILIFIILTNIFIFELKNNVKKNIIFLIILILGWSVFGVIRLKTLKLESTNTKISLVQVSILQNKKWENSNLQPTIELYEEYTHKAILENPDLIIWPESALPVYTLKQIKYRNFVKNLATKNNTDIFLGMPHYKYVGEGHQNKYKYYNVATRFGKNGKIDSLYCKNILVPFGERIPFLKYFPFLWNVHLGQANWEYGTEQKFYIVNGYRYSPLICFEIAFAKLTRNMVIEGVDFIVNITNDAWFYRSAGTYQHAMMTKFRAIETRKQIFRAANTGYSLIIAPTGEILQKSKLFEKIILTDELQICKSKSIYAHHLFWFPYIFLLGVILLFLAEIVMKINKIFKKIL